MKKILFISFFAAIMTLMSCNKQELPVPDDKKEAVSQDNDSDELYRIVISGVDDDETKAGGISSINLGIATMDPTLNIEELHTATLQKRPKGSSEPWENVAPDLVTFTWKSNVSGSENICTLKADPQAKKITRECSFVSTGPGDFDITIDAYIDNQKVATRGTAEKPFKVNVTENREISWSEDKMTIKGNETNFIKLSCNTECNVTITSPNSDIKIALTSNPGEFKTNISVPFTTNSDILVYLKSENKYNDVSVNITAETDFQKKKQVNIVSNATTPIFYLSPVFYDLGGPTHRGNQEGDIIYYSYFLDVYLGNNHLVLDQDYTAEVVDFGYTKNGNNRTSFNFTGNGLSDWHSGIAIYDDTDRYHSDIDSNWPDLYDMHIQESRDLIGMTEILIDVNTYGMDTQDADGLFNKNLYVKVTLNDGSEHYVECICDLQDFASPIDLTPIDPTLNGLYFEITRTSYTGQDATPNVSHITRKVFPVGTYNEYGTDKLSTTKYKGEFLFSELKIGMEYDINGSCFPWLLQTTSLSDIWYIDHGVNKHVTTERVSEPQTLHDNMVSFNRYASHYPYTDGRYYHGSHSIVIDYEITLPDGTKGIYAAIVYESDSFGGQCEYYYPYAGPDERQILEMMNTLRRQ